MFSCLLQFSSAFGTICILRHQKKAAVRTMICSTAVHTDNRQIFITQLNIFAVFNRFSQFSIDGKNSIAAVRNSIIRFAPFKKRDKKEAEVSVNHKNRNAAVTAALFADHRLSEKIKVFSALRNTANKYHKYTSFSMGKSGINPSFHAILFLKRIHFTSSG